LLSILAPATQVTLSNEGWPLAWNKSMGRTADGVMMQRPVARKVRVTGCPGTIRSSRPDGSTHAKSAPRLGALVSSSFPRTHLLLSLASPDRAPSPCLPLRQSRTTPHRKRNSKFRRPCLRCVERRNWRRCILLLGTRTRRGEISSFTRTASFVCS
jgi:hypothetical protein